MAPAATPELAELFVKSLNDDNPWVRVAAIQALTAMGPARTPDLVELLVESLNDDNPWVRVAAIRALTAMGPRAELVVKFLKDEDPQLRMAAIQALAAVDSAAAPKLAERFAEFFNEDDPHVWRPAAWALERLGARHEPAVRALTSSLDHEVIQVRITAARALGNVGPPARSAIPALRELLNSADPLLRTAVSKSLKKIDPLAFEE